MESIIPDTAHSQQSSQQLAVHSNAQVTELVRLGGQLAREFAFLTVLAKYSSNLSQADLTSQYVLIRHTTQIEP